MPIKLAVFNITVTTVKDSCHIGEALQAALKKSRYDVPIELINPLLTYEITQAIRQLLRVHEHNDAKINSALVKIIHGEFVKQMIEWYRTAPGIEPLPNVEGTFKKLHEKGIKIGVNTSFSKKIAETIINRLGWDKNKLVDYVAGSDEVELGQPYPLMIKKIMAEAGITKKNEVVKVGDTEIDVREGQNSGCKYVVAITTGIFSRKQLEECHPTHIIDDMAQLVAIIDS